MNSERSIKDVLADLMREGAGISANELARRTGVPQPTITRILNGESKDPDTRTVTPLASYFGKSVAYLRGETALQESVADYLALPAFSRGPRLAAVPLISWVQAGNWNHASDPHPVGDAEEWLPCPVPHSPSTFALRVRGVSMEPAFHDGEYIFVDPALEPRHKHFVVVRLANRDEATFKQFVMEEGRKFLKPVNPAWPDPIIELGEDAVICGVVVFKGSKM